MKIMWAWMETFFPKFASVFVLIFFCIAVSIFLYRWYLKNKYGKIKFEEAYKDAWNDPRFDGERYLRKFGLSRTIVYCAFFLVFCGIIVPYALQVFLPFFFSGDYTADGLNSWNGFVSIVLGSVGTISAVCSIASASINRERDITETKDRQKVLQEMSEAIKLIKQSVEEIRLISQQMQLDIKVGFAQRANNGGEMIPREVDSDRGPSLNDEE